MTLEGFSRNMRRISRKLPFVVDKVVKQVALSVDQTLVLATPVDTGKARSNWRVGVGNSPSTQLEPFSPGEKLGIGEGANARAAIEAGKATIETRKPGQTIYINNNVPYIGKLNEGSSAQAPAMFVEQAVEAGVRVVQNVRLDL